jgi:hypothetical protein
MNIKQKKWRNAMNTQAIEDAFAVLLGEISGNEENEATYARAAELEADVVGLLNDLMDKVAFMEQQAEQKAHLWECKNLLCGNVFKSPENRCPKCYG